MQSLKNKKGVALGALFALVFSIFGAVPAAQASSTDGAHIAIRPLSNANTSNFVGLLTEDFPVYAELLPGAANANTNFAGGTLKWKIERVSGNYDILAAVSTVSATPGSATLDMSDLADRYSTSANIELQDASHQKSVSYSTFVSVWQSSTSAVLSAKLSTDATGYAPLVIRADSYSFDINSASPEAVVRVTAWIDTQGGVQNGLIDSDEWRTSQLITLKPTSGLSPSYSVGSPQEEDDVVTASATLANVNWGNLNGSLFLAMRADEGATWTKNTAAADGATVTSSKITGTVATTRLGVVTESFDVRTGGLSASNVVGIQLRYAENNTVTDNSSGVLIGPARALTQGYFSVGVADAGVDLLSISAVATANVAGGGTGYDIRQNQTYTIRVHASSNSVSVSQTVTLTTGGTDLVTSSKMLSINGGAFQTTDQSFTVTTNASTGYGSFTIATSGFVASDTLTLKANIGNVESSLVTFTVRDATYTATADYSTYLVTPGGTANVGFTVKDQWAQTYSGTDHFVKVTRTGTAGFNWATSVSYTAVTNGTATLAFVPEPAAVTGSATLTYDIMKLSNGAYIDAGTGGTVTVYVSSTVDSFGTGLAASYSAYVSYFPSTVSWVTITGKVANSGSAVVVSGDGLIFRASSALPTTTSDTIAVRANGTLDYTFDVAALHSGNKTITLTNASATTTSLLVVAPATFSNGVNIAFDTTEIVAGKTKIVTGTVTDENGNGVYTAGTASITVAYAGTAGIPVGSMPTQTDADGNFRISILTSAADSGTFTLTAVYLKNGASTATADRITKVQAITVGATSATPSADQKVNAGSFKGYVAVYAKGYEGKRLSAKVGNDWVVVPALASNFVRVVEFTGAGYTIAVRIYIDRVLVDTITVTTK